MATKTVVCPECAEPVPPGRLACPACGSLIAFVADPSRVPVAPAAQPPVVPDPSEPELEGDPAGAADEVEPSAAEASSLGPDVESGFEPGPGDGFEPGVDPEAAPDAAPAPEAAAGAAAVGLPAVLHDWPPPAAMPAPDEPQWPNRSEPQWPPARQESAWPPAPPERARATYASVDDPEPERAAASFAVAPGGAAVATAGFTPAGAYLPPSGVFVPGPATPESSTARPGRAGWFADLPFESPDDLPSWFVAAGSGVAAAGFVLPWARAVIGAESVGSYLDSWGLGAPMHLPVFLVALAVLALAVLPNRLASWLSGIVLPLFLGGLLLGLAWPYVVGPLGAQLGAWAEVIGAVLLVVGGSLSAARPNRHAENDPGV